MDNNRRILRIIDQKDQKQGKRDIFGEIPMNADPLLQRRNSAIAKSDTVLETSLTDISRQHDVK